MSGAAIHAPAAVGREGSGRRSLVAMAIYVVAAAFDGFDGQVVAFLAPALARGWQVPVSAFGPVFSIGLLGTTLGGIALAPLGDRFGRRRLVVLASCGIGLTMLGSALATSIAQLAAWRFLVGLGLGAMMPGLVSVAHESAPRGRGGLYVTILVSGFPAGGFLGGLLVAWSLPHIGWQSLFVGIGLFAFLLAALLALVADDVRASPADGPRATPAALFRDDRAIPTLLVWLLFLATLANVYLLASWLPALLERGGFAPRTAVLAAAGSNLGGMIGGLAIGALFTRFGARLLGGAYLLAVLAIAGLGLVDGAIMVTVALSFVVGFLIPGGHVANSALAAGLYPAAIRATGIGWAQSVGRISSIMAPALVGLAIRNAVPNRAIFLGSALVAAIAVVAAFALARRTIVQRDR